MMIDTKQSLPKNIPLHKIIKDISGHEVIPVNLSDKKDRELVEALRKVAEEVIFQTKQVPIVSKSKNEVGNKIEPVVESAFNTIREYKIECPKTNVGKKNLQVTPIF